jgi:hypothetical protein
MTAAELTTALDRHDAWLARSPSGVRLDLSRQAVQGGDFRGRDLSWAVFGLATLADCSLDWCDLRCCDFRNADLLTATFSRSILAGSVFAGARVNWSSPELVGELIAREAATPARQRLAAWIADPIRGPWPGPVDDPEWPWAQAVLARYR